MVDPQTVLHAGELDPKIMAMIIGASAGLARLIAPFMPKAWMGLACAAVLSTVSVWVWAWSAYAWSREGSFALFVGWGVILAATASVFGGSSAANLSGAANTLTLGRLGTAKENA